LDNATETGKGVEMTLRNTVRKSIAALGMLATAAVPASAADIYGGGLKDQPVYVAAPTWTGFYFGVHGGGGWGSIDLNRNLFTELKTNPDGTLVTNPDGTHTPIFTAPFTTSSINSSGGFGGGQFGYNWQGGSSCCWVYGLEVDIGAASNNFDERRLAFVTNDINALVRIKSNNNNGNFYGDVTGRLGYTWGSTLIYAKGGFAWLNTELRVQELITNSAGTTVLFNGNDNSNNNTLTGWTVGGGIEYMLNTSWATNWSVKVEYLHFDFSNVQNDHCCGDEFFNDFRFFKNNLTFDTVKAGVSYHFQPAVVLPYK
jgi:opacity protein-like surface antigen